MTLDLLHNKIIKETLTENFEKSVNDNLIPKLYALYGTSLEGVQFYEDYIKDEFIKDGYWYYPLTVVIGGINAVIWIKWDVSVLSEFENGVPYAYQGNGEIDFLIADDVPIAFKNALEGRSNYFEGGYVKLNVTTDAPNPTILAGKYSQTFIDEMNRQLSSAISKACGVRGLEDSSIELDIVFAPNTYMEHTSENVTYRRLLISAKGCSARDFWIKWTRKNSAVAYSVNDNVSGEDIVFELGEDVSQKIREKEYRFLVYGNSDRYRVAMGRKNVTEWRELIKRAVKRGELSKTTAELEEEAHVAEVSDKLSEILEKCGVTLPVSTSNEIRVDAEAANEALRLAVLGDGEAEGENYVPEITAAPVSEPETESVQQAEETEEVAIAEENNDTESEVFEVAGEDNSIFDQTDDADEFNFDGGNVGFEVNEEEVTELSFEDILQDFIPKAAEEEAEEEEIQPAESLDISDIDESESVLLSINKNDSDVPFDFDNESEEDSENETAEYEADEEEASENEEFELEIYEEESEEVIKSENEYADEITEIEEEYAEDGIESEEDNIAEDGEPGENGISKEETVGVSLYNDDEIARLEMEIANTKRLLEIERIAKEAAEAKLEQYAIEKENFENMLAAERKAKEEAQDILSREREAKEEAESKISAAYIAKETAENQINLERLASAELRAQIEKQKFAIEQVKLLVDEETNARKLAEAEAERLRGENDVLKSENMHLVEVARVSEEACREAELKCKEHERELLNQIELIEKERTREKNLFAEAARQAKEENERQFAEYKEAEAIRLEEEARIDALRRAEEERLRREEELRLEKERIDNEVARRMQEEENRRRSIEDRAREARLRMEEKARLNAEARANASSEYAKPQIITAEAAPVSENSTVADFSEYADEAPAYVNSYDITEVAEEAAVEVEETVTPEPVVNYTYTSKIVRLMFRRSADPNITSRIHEMISYALTEFKKEHVYIKVKASMPDNSTVILNFVKFPEEEFQLLVDIINYLGKSDLGIYKIILE